MRKSKRILCALLACVMMGSMLLVGDLWTPTQAQAATISDLEAEAAQHEANLEEINRKLEEAEANKASAMEQKGLLDEQAELLSQQISNAESQIAALEGNLAANEAEEQRQYALFCRQVREEEERGVYSFWSVIFKAASFEDLLGRVDFVNEVAEYNNSVISQLRTLRQTMQEDKAKLETQKVELDGRKQELQVQLNAARALVAEYTESAAGYEAMAAEEQAKADSIASEIESRRENTASSSGSGSGSSSGGIVSESGYIWPTDSRYITSSYGMRVHPIFGYNKMHTGIDIAASYGTNVYASKSGTVTTANWGWGGGYGNYVEIDHGGGNYTLYAHMSSLAVSEGQRVEQGQVIGYCGSTGNSTGPHVHFEIFEGYSRLDPLTRLAGDYSHSDDWNE